MGLTRVEIPIPAQWAGSALESELLRGPHGVPTSFAAVGAGDEVFDIAIAQRYRGAEPDERLELGIVVGRNLHMGWSNVACGMLAAYGVHLVRLRAQVQQHLDDLPGIASSGRYAEVRGRLAQRTPDGFDLEVLQNDQAQHLALADATGAERSVWEGLGSRCMCPACLDLCWTAEEADAVASTIRPKDRGALHAVKRCMEPTPALFRAAILAGVHPLGGRNRFGLWTERSLPLAAQAARELLAHRSGEVRRAALHVVLAAAVADEGDARALIHDETER